MRSLSPLLLLSGVLGLSSCGSDAVEVNLFFGDELIEAPAREVEVVGLSAGDCETLLSLPHAEAMSAGTVLFTTKTRWPVRPDSEIFADIPPGQEITLLVAAYDSEGVLIARGCQIVNIGGGERTDMQLHALPMCTEGPSVLDVTILLDTSTKMEIVDPELQHLEVLVPRLIETQEYPAGTTWSIVTYGNADGVVEVLPPTPNLEAVRSAVTTLRMTHNGPARLWDGVFRSTAIQRSRAVCGRRPAMVIIAGSIDAGSQRLFEDASIGILAARGDENDDIFTYGIALDQDTYEELADLIPEGYGEVTGAPTNFLRTTALGNAAMSLRALVP